MVEVHRDCSSLLPQPMAAPQSVVDFRVQGLEGLGRKHPPPCLHAHVPRSYLLGALRGLMLCRDAHSLSLQMRMPLSDRPTHTRRFKVHSRLSLSMDFCAGEPDS